MHTAFWGVIMSNQLYTGELNNMNKIMKSSKKVDN